MNFNRLNYDRMSLRSLRTISAIILFIFLIFIKKQFILVYSKRAWVFRVLFAGYSLINIDTSWKISQAGH
jgi:hypothetical protein